MLVTLEAIVNAGEVTSPTFGMYEPAGLEEVAVDGDRCLLFSKVRPSPAQPPAWPLSL